MQTSHSITTSINHATPAGSLAKIPLGARERGCISFHSASIETLRGKNMFPTREQAWQRAVYSHTSTQGVGATHDHELRRLVLLTCTVVTSPDAPVRSHEPSYTVRQLRASADLRTKSPRTKSQQMALTVPYCMHSIQRGNYWGMAPSGSLRLARSFRHVLASPSPSLVRKESGRLGAKDGRNLAHTRLLRRRRREDWRLSGG